MNLKPFILSIFLFFYGCKIYNEFQISGSKIKTIKDQKNKIHFNIDTPITGNKKLHLYHYSNNDSLNKLFRQIIHHNKKRVNSDVFLKSMRNFSKVDSALKSQQYKVFSHIGIRDGSISLVLDSDNKIIIWQEFSGQFCSRYLLPSSQLENLSLSSP